MQMSLDNSINRFKFSNPVYNELYQCLSSKTTATLPQVQKLLSKYPLKLVREKKGNQELKRGKIFLGNRQVVSQEMLEQIMSKELLTGACPMSCEGAYYYLRTRYCGEVTRKIITEFIKSLEGYQLENVRPPDPTQTKGSYYKNSEGVTRHLFSGKNSNDLGADLMYIPKQWSKYKFFLVVVHLRSGYSWVSPLTERKSKDLITPFTHILEDSRKRFGKVNNLHTDPGVEFLGDFKDFLKTQKITLNNEFKSYQSERKIQQFGKTLSKLLAQKVGFSEAVVLAAKKMNNTINRTTGVSPDQYIPGKTKLKPNRKLKMGSRTRRKPVTFSVGDNVRYLLKHAEQLNTFYKSYGASSRKDKHCNWSKTVLRIVQIKKIFGALHYRISGMKKWFKPWQLQKVPEKLRILTAPLESFELSTQELSEKKRIDEETPDIRSSQLTSQLESDLGSYWTAPLTKRRRKRVKYSS